MEQLNRENEITGLIQKIDSIENAINQDTTEEKIVNMISEMKEEQSRKIEELDSSKVLSDILEKMDMLTQSQNENIEKNGLETRYLLENSNVETRNLLANNQEETKNLIEKSNETTRSILEEKMANLNYKQEIDSLMNKLNNLEDNMNNNEKQESIKMIEEKIQAMILEMKEEQNKTTQRLLEDKMQDMLNAMKLETTENTMKMLEENFKTMITNIMENQNATQSLLEEKMANLNYKDEISSLMSKITDVEQAINSKDSEEKLSKVVEKMKADNEKKLEKLDSSAQIKEIMKELKKINTRYDKLALEVNKNLTEMKKASQTTAKQPTKQTTKTKSANKNKVIELETAKKKLKQEELIIEYGKEIFLKRIYL